MLERIDELLEQKVDFAIETTLTTLSYQKTIAIAKSRGYMITLLFFWLNDVNLAIERVKTRVMEGGHSIPQEVIIRRYYKGILNLTNVFVNLCHYWLIIDNSSCPYSFVAEGNGEITTMVYNEQTRNKLNNLKNERG